MGTENAQRRLQVEADVTLACFCAGPEDAPAVLLVHGFPDDHRVWDGVAERLAARFRVLRYDVRGAGASSRPAATARYTLPRLATDLLAVARALGAGRPVHLVGHDWGSIQAWEAVVQPDAQALLASFVSISGPSLDHVGASLREPPRSLPASLRQALASWYVAAFHLPFAERWAPRLLARGAQRFGFPARGDDFMQNARFGIKLYRANMRQRLLAPKPRATSLPVTQLVLRDDAYVLPPLAELAAPYAPALQRRELPGGHWALCSDPARFAAEISAAIERTERA